jgi:4'-phosphopantetheinyl transferase
VNDSTIPGDSFLSADEFRLAPNRVDIWTAPIQASREIIDQLKQTLSSDELERALRFHAADHQDLFVAGRGILRAILSCYVSDGPDSLAFRYGTKGKPHLLDHANVRFNLGHSGGRAVYAVAGDDLGVDIELIKPLVDWEKISARFFSAREAEELKGLDPARQIAGFFACWTRKEAYIKATGDGLGAGLGKFYAGVDPLQADGTIEEEGHPRRWYFKDLKLGDQYAGAIVTRFAQCRIHSFNFQQTEDCLRFVQRHRGT